jgi:hypothetical protein
MSCCLTLDAFHYCSFSPHGFPHKAKELSPGIYLSCGIPKDFYMFLGFIDKQFWISYICSDCLNVGKVDIIM